MLTEDQIRKIVGESFKKTSGSNIQSWSNTLKDEDIDQSTLRQWVTTLVNDEEIGVSRFQHKLEFSAIIKKVSPSDTFESLGRHVFLLSTGKVCSNPITPHSQTCCPYPKKCPECGHDVR